jgi:hypothetical protein
MQGYLLVKGLHTHVRTFGRETTNRIITLAMAMRTLMRVRISCFDHEDEDGGGTGDIVADIGAAQAPSIGERRRQAHR